MVHLSGLISTKQCWLTLIIFLSFIHLLIAFYISIFTILLETNAGLNQDFPLTFSKYWPQINIFPIFWNFNSIPRFIKNECLQLSFFSQIPWPFQSKLLKEPPPISAIHLRLCKVTRLFVFWVYIFMLLSILPCFVLCAVTQNNESTSRCVCVLLRNMSTGVS